MKNTTVSAPTKKCNNSKESVYMGKNEIELYINEDGNIVISYLNRDNLPLFKVLADNPSDLPSIYCG